MKEKRNTKKIALHHRPQSTEFVYVVLASVKQSFEQNNRATQSVSLYFSTESDTVTVIYMHVYVYFLRRQKNIG